MGLPQIDITFSELAVSAIKRSTRGIVALILRDDTNASLLHEISTITDVKSDDWTDVNMQYIKHALSGVPKKVIVIKGDTTDTDYNDQLNQLINMEWNWLAVPGVSSGDSDDIATWIKGQRAAKKTFKAVLPNTAADDESVVNFVTEGIEVDSDIFTASQYTARIAGIFAGLSLDRSATYFELEEVDGITESSNPGADVDEGKLVIIKQGEKYKIARAVNSLTSATTTKASQFKKIKIVEGMDLIQDDITTTFNDEYVGKVPNSYDNQVLFITAVNAYLNGLEGDVLDANYSNSVSVDVEAQREAWKGVGTDTTDMSDQDVKEMAFQSNVYLQGAFKFLDAMEDLQLAISLN